VACPFSLGLHSKLRRSTPVPASISVSHSWNSIVDRPAATLDKALITVLNPPLTGILCPMETGRVPECASTAQYPEEIFRTDPSAILRSAGLQ